MGAETPAAVATVGIGFWLWRIGAFVTIFGTGGAALYYKGKAEGVSKEANSEALELAEQKRALAEEKIRLADIQRQQAEVAQERAELARDHADGSGIEAYIGWGLAGMALTLVVMLLIQRANGNRARRGQPAY